ncbi:hypothetical protein LTR64_005264 [Lithohypha guttulata]|uniref:uncharacterized protein n=1 Tax=Lithohypha guttulata TaxID=1690604 RepID=UPI002DE0E617|nr:hypothetical protein LTR51_002944 [Lithohypha guttulata]
MGIRNLAYAFLTCKMTEELKNTPLKYEKPILCHWQRTDLMSPQSQAMDYNEGDTIRSQTPSIVDSMIATVATDESFEPIVLAGHAYRFAKYCASLKPTHILIERQRFRSGGHSAVQEWSLRVGMLESMLHATFRTLVEEKLLLGTTVEQVLPMRVNKFWFTDEDVPATGKAAKVAKIALVNDMLKSVGAKTASFSLHEDVRNTVDGFGAKGSRAAGSKKAPTLEKLDDMSDALLQGLAWLRWQENRNRLVTHGVDALGIEV